VTDERPSFFARIWIAWVAYFRVLFDGDFAAGVQRLRSGTASPSLPPPAVEMPREAAKKPQVVMREAPTDAALQLLALLQRRGRLVDFLEEDIAGAKDAEIGAAARVVHEGCRQAVHEHFTLVPVREENEEARIDVPAGFDAGAIRLTGNVVGEPPFRGTLRHRGWRCTEVKLPKITEGHDVRVIAAAEVEL
jgi:hypothetical protein